MTVLATCATYGALQHYAVTDSYEYDAFGNQITHTGTTPNNYLYRGEQWDPDLGLYYLRARYYNPLTGRFMSRDPNSGEIKNPITLHKYLYADGDPVNTIDPMGRGALLEGVYLEVGAITAKEALEFTFGPLTCSAAIHWYAWDLVKGSTLDDVIVGALFNAGCLIGLAVVG